MFDQGVDLIEISIKNDNEILNSYYIMRSENEKGTASIIEIESERSKFEIAAKALKGLYLYYTVESAQSYPRSLGTWCPSGII
jgi:hypothetical protein